MAIRLTTTLPVFDFTNIAKAKPGTSYRLSPCRFEPASFENQYRYLPRTKEILPVGKISPKLREDIVCRAKVAGSSDQLPTNNLPVLDLSNVADLKPRSSSWLFACRDVQNALVEHGFFVGSFDKFTPNLKEDVYFAIKELFDLPAEKKKDYDSVESNLAYVVCPNSPLYEGIVVINSADGKTAEHCINFMFPPRNERFSKCLDGYADLVAGLQEMIIRMVFESYGLEKYFDSHRESICYVLRINKYRAPTANEDNVGLGRHTDQTFLTVLSSAQTQGLEIEGKDGNWFPVDIPPSSFLILAGDALEAWSNGRIRSCLHQVTMNAAKEARYSISTFFLHKGKVAIPKELVDDAHPLLYKPFDHFELLQFSRTREGGSLVGKERLQAFCGIN